MISDEPDDDDATGLEKDCESCGSTENITTCDFCGVAMCFDCCEDHEPVCDDNDHWDDEEDDA